MSVQFAGQSLFSSGPHKLVLGRYGRFIAPPFPQGGGPEFSIDFALRERRMQVRGRVTGVSMSQLFARFNAIRDLAEAGTVGTITWEGQSWTGMRMIDLDAQAPVDRGRVLSIAYVVTFLKMIA